VVTVVISAASLPSLGSATSVTQTMTEISEIVDNPDSADNIEELEYEWLGAITTIANSKPDNNLIREPVDSSGAEENFSINEPIVIYGEETTTSIRTVESAHRRSGYVAPDPIDDLLAFNFILAPAQETYQLDQYDIALSEKAAKENLRRATQSMRDQMSDAAAIDRQSEKLADIALRVTGVSLSAGSLAWLLQSGSLFASALSSIPTWQGFDPLPVLAKKRNPRRWIFGRNRKKHKQANSKDTAAGRILDSVNIEGSAEPRRGSEG